MQAPPFLAPFLGQYGPSSAIAMLGRRCADDPVGPEIPHRLSQAAPSHNICLPS
jgi:hypothetical protein